jgi:Uri superfamily endonuclease
MQPRTYQIVFRLCNPLSLPVGALGVRRFPAGRYVYTGSARRGLEARLRRHLSRDKRLRWHIDYLLSAPGVEVLSTRTFVEEECAVSQATAGEIPVEGFGASDCRRGCGSHLKYLGA